MSTATVPRTTPSRRRVSRTRDATTGSRLRWLAWSLSLLACIVFEVVKHDLPVWPVVGFVILPDLSFLVAIGAGPTAPGQLARRAVPVYNLVHRPWLPLALIVLASFAVMPLIFFVGGLAWLLHIAVDHVSGYGLRTADGWQRA